MIAWIFIWSIFSVIILIINKGVGDHGDGIMHYLFAKYAHLHPKNFLDPWAKPGYTLLAWPFAQFGLKGVMLMNILSVIIVMWLCFRIGEMLDIRFAWLGPIILSLSTFYFKLMYSGLTEHLFSLILVLSIYNLLKNKWTCGAILLSTLPCFRQEGYIIIASLIPFFFLQRKLIKIPYLGIGVLTYNLIGSIVYSDPLWIIHSNPYGLHMTYGKGSWTTFFVHLYYNSGFLNFILFIIGLTGLIIHYLIEPKEKNKRIILTILTPFIIFFIAHTIFWTFGIFHSYGMQRVLNCVAPLWAIIAGMSAGYINMMVKNKRIIIITTVSIVLTVVIFPFVPSPANIPWDKNFKLTKNESCIYEACYFLKEKSFDKFIITEHPLVYYLLDKDPFNPLVSARISDLDRISPPRKSILFWENGFAKSQAGVEKSIFVDDTTYTLLAEFQSDDQRTEVAIFGFQW